jgi:predicted N-acetyltransferase YhbS
MLPRTTGHSCGGLAHRTLTRIGRALVEDAAARVVRAGSSEMTVVAHPRNFAFYESAGFVVGEPVATASGRP